jgi:hypothetical protein
MQIEKMTDRVRGVLLWIYIVVVIAGIIYVAGTGQATKTPGVIVYEKIHKR